MSDSSPPDTIAPPARPAASGPSMPAATVEVPQPTPASERVKASAVKVGVLLVNLGTPDSADAAGVRRYLKEFLSDPRVIENQGLVWKIVLNGIILRIRPRIKARDYQKIWNTELDESPLKTIHALAGAEACQHAQPVRQPHHGRLGDALRQSLDRVARHGAVQPGLRAHSGDSALSAIFRRDDRDGVRRGVSRAHQSAPTADAADRGALLR